MAKDKYSDSHTIDVFNDEQQLNIYTTGSDSPIEIKAGDPTYGYSVSTESDIVLNAEDDILIYADHYVEINSDNRILLTTTDAGVDPANSATGSAGDIALNASKNIYIYADEDVFIKVESGVTITNESVADQTGLIVNNTDTSNLNQCILKLMVGGVDQVSVNGRGDLTATGEVKCTNFQMTSGASNGYYLVSDGDGDASWFEVDNSVIDWTDISPDSSVKIVAPGRITIRPTGQNNLHLGGDSGSDAAGTDCKGVYICGNSDSGAIKLKQFFTTSNQNGSGTASYENYDGNHHTLIAADSDGDISLYPTNDNKLRTANNKITLIQGTNSASHTGTQNGGSHICHIHNKTTGSQADGLRVSLGKEFPTSTNLWVQFISNHTSGGGSDDYAAGNNRGRIRGSDDADTIAFQTPDGGGPGLSSGNTIPSSSYDYYSVGTAGNCVYASGDSDFGEWFECGNPYEWFENIEDAERRLEGHRAYLDIPEGIVVYVRDKKFYRSQPGVPMVATRRALLVGNEKPDAQEQPGWLGQILSFVGQVPVYFLGEAKSGDFLIDSGEGYCVPVSPGDVTMKEYIKTIGRALEDADSTKQRRVMCAINYK